MPTTIPHSSQNLQEVMSLVAMQRYQHHTDMIMASSSLQSTSATVLVGAIDVQLVPTNNKVAADVLARPVQASATEYEGLHLTYTIPHLNKINYVDWAAKTENLLEIQDV